MPRSTRTAVARGRSSSQTSSQRAASTQPRFFTYYPSQHGQTGASGRRGGAGAFPGDDETESSASTGRGGSTSTASTSTGASSTDSRPSEPPRFFTLQLPDHIRQHSPGGNSSGRSSSLSGRLRNNSSLGNLRESLPRFFTYHPPPPAPLAQRRKKRTQAERPPPYMFTYQPPARAGTFSMGSDGPGIECPPPSYEAITQRVA